MAILAGVGYGGAIEAGATLSLTEIFSGIATVLAPLVPVGLVALGIVAICGISYLVYLSETHDDAPPQPGPAPVATTVPNKDASTAVNPPLVGEPNSSAPIYDRNGNVIGERNYGPDGRAVSDEHYTDHGNPATHPDVPHEHDWDWSDPSHPQYVK